MKASVPDSLWLGIPCFSFLIASICGWFGIMIGVIFGFLSAFASLFLAGYYVLQIRKHWRKDRHIVLYFVLIAISIAGFYTCFGFQKNPFMNTFRARIKHEYSKHIPEIQTWAAATLKTARPENYTIDMPDRPIWMHIQGLPNPRVVLCNDGNSPSFILIAWFNVGTCGFKVGGSTLQIQSEKIADGIYFFGGR